MNMYNTDDLRIKEIKELVTPELLINELAVSEEASATVHAARLQMRNVLDKTDDRLAVVVGPCSIHDPNAARDYAKQLVQLRERYSEDLLVMMRVYFEKPRTTVGWKGLINDPNLDDSFEINEGLRLARSLLLDLADMGLPVGSEFLDLISPQYIADLISWGAIGARTTESQSHRELASGLSCPVGFKNGTAGSVQMAVDAIRSASQPHHFLSVTKAGNSAIFATSGNTDCHIILRGGKHTNYDAASVDDASALLQKAGLNSSLMVDFSHANSRKIPERQHYVCRDVCAQVSGGDDRITGVMIESNIVAGRQDIVNDRELTYGQSVTDACVDMSLTERMLDDLAQAVRERREVKNNA